MTDVFSPAKRSEIMRGIKSVGNRSTELSMLACFRKARIIGWRRHDRMLGRPDFTFQAARVVVFVDGDFWHGNPRTFKLPKTNTRFWREKIHYNRTNDKKVTRQLKRNGWTVIRIWESALKRRPQACVARVVRALKKNK
jgi:DNA mismatch endonuclease (patch repair protein)